MPRRLVLTAIILVLLACLCCFCWGAVLLVFMPGPQPAAPVQTTPPSTGATPTPGADDSLKKLSDQIKTGSETLEHLLFPPALALLRICGVLLGVILGSFLAAWFIDEWLKQKSGANLQVIVLDFVDGTGEEIKAGALKGLSLEARKSLDGFLVHLKSFIGRYASLLGLEDETIKKINPQIVNVLDQTLENLITSVSSVAPDYLKPVLKFLELILPGYGYQLEGMFLLSGSSLVVSHTLTDLSTRRVVSALDLGERDMLERPYAGDCFGAAIPEPPPAQPDSSNAGAAENRRKVYDDAAKRLIDLGFHKDAAELITASQSPAPTPMDRYERLLQNAMFWMTLELLRVEVFRKKHVPGPATATSAWKAPFYNVFGVMYFVTAQSMAFKENVRVGQFFEKAIADLTEATNHFPAWPQPWINLGDAYIAYGMMDCSDPSPFYQALQHYTEGAQRATTTGSPAQQEIDQARARLGKATAYLYLGQVQEAVRLIQELEDGEKWKTHAVMEAYLYYDLARWYALAVARKSEVPEAEIKGKRALAVCLARDRLEDYWHTAGEEALLQKWGDRLPGFLQALRLECKENPAFPTTTGEEFVRVMDRMIDTSGWLRAADNQGPAPDLPKKES